MKKLLTTLVAVLMALCAVFAIGCAPKQVIETEDQLAALTEVKAGTSDIAVIDSVMANYYVNSPNFNSLMILSGDEFDFASEYYAIGARKGDGSANYNTAKYITAALYQLQQDGVISTIAEKYGLTDALYTIGADEVDETISLGNLPTDQSDFAKILNKGKLVLGYTLFEPIAYMDGTELIGFDIELAKAVCDLFGIELVTEKIVWDTKEDELNGGNIDLIWNGFTYTSKRAENINFTSYYMVNRQAIVIRKADADKYTSFASMKGAKFAAESESAGESTIRDIILPQAK